VIQRAFRYRLYPSDEQADKLAQFVGVTRLVYNLALEQRTAFGRRGRLFNYATQGLEITALRREVDWIGAAPSGALTQALRDLDRAFAAFFSRRAGYPTPRKKGLNDSFRCQLKEIRIRTVSGKWAVVRVPNLGWVKFRRTREMRGTIQNATFSRTALGWFVSFAATIEHEAVPSTLPSVGIDRGVANTLALSTGELLSTPDLSHLERRKKRAQRILARRVRGSNRYRKQRRRLGRITAKIARCRADWRHKATLDIAQRFGAVALEDLRVVNMTASGKGKRGLNRSILEQGWGEFERVLSYKLEERGGTLVKVDPAYTSQTCSACGTIDKASRESQSSFACRHCGFTAHADHNAAINIQRRSAPLLPVEASRWGADEAGTINHAIAA
jgi:putative transposase